MSVMSDRQSVAANTVVQNVLSGKSQEFVNEPALIRYYGTASAVGLFVTLIVGDEVAMEDQEINAQNRMPIVPDDFVVEAGALPGDRIVLKLRNSTGAAITAFSKIEVSPA